MSVPNRFRIAANSGTSSMPRVVEQFVEIARRGSMQDAENVIENFIATCTLEEYVDAMQALRPFCVERNLGQKFNKWRMQFVERSKQESASEEELQKFNKWRMQFVERSKQESPSEEELQHLPFQSHSELVQMLEEMLNYFAPAITQEEALSGAMGAMDISGRKKLPMVTPFNWEAAGFTSRPKAEPAREADAADGADETLVRQNTKVYVPPNAGEAEALARQNTEVYVPPNNGSQVAGEAEELVGERTPPYEPASGDVFDEPT